MKKRDIGILIGGTLIGMSTVMTGAAGWVLKNNFTRRKPKAEKPGQIESMDAMHMDYLRRKNIGRVQEQETEELDIMSEDGLILHAHYVHNKEVKRLPGEPVNVVLLSHGYGGSGYKDLVIFADYYLKKGFDLLIIDQRTHGRSEGSFITFGAREQNDISRWVGKIIEIAGSDCRILLHGWSMGAATIYLAVVNGLPDNVKGLVYDCGYAVAEAQMLDTAHKFSKLPKSILWYVMQYAKPLCRLFLGFDMNEAAPFFAADEMMLPIFFVHGAEDSCVPLWMGKSLYKATLHTPYRKMLIVPGAEHTYSYVCDKKGYEQGISALLEKCGMN